MWLKTPLNKEQVQHDTVSERLRRWTRHPLGSARRGSNPLGVEFDADMHMHASATSVINTAGYGQHEEHAHLNNLLVFF